MAYYTLGFTEAQDRLFQMDRIRKTVQGRTSELFGEKALDLDILMRSLSIEHAVKREMHKVPEEQKKLLEAYADGVNALVEHAGLPIEYTILGAEFNQWEWHNVLLTNFLIELGLSARGIKIAPRGFGWSQPYGLAATLPLPRRHSPLVYDTERRRA